MYAVRRDLIKRLCRLVRCYPPYCVRSNPRSSVRFTEGTSTPSKVRIEIKIVLCRWCRSPRMIWIDERLTDVRNSVAETQIGSNPFCYSLCQNNGFMNVPAGYAPFRPAQLVLVCNITILSERTRRLCKFLSVALICLPTQKYLSNIHYLSKPYNFRPRIIEFECSAPFSSGWTWVLMDSLSNDPFWKSSKLVFVPFFAEPLQRSSISHT